MNLIIQKKHCIGTSFDSIKDDALSRAIKEQLPDLQVKSVFSDFFVDIEGNQYIFNTSEFFGYCRRSFNKLKDGLIKQISLDIQMSNLPKKNVLRIL